MQYENGMVESTGNGLPNVAARDLQIPLQKIKGYLNMAVSHHSQGRQSDTEVSLQKCFSEVEGLSHYISSILSFSAIEAGQLKSKGSWVSVGSLFQDVDRQFSVKCRSHSELMWSCFGVGHVDCEAHLNKTLLMQAVNSAVNHAIEHTNRGFIKVSYRIDNGNLNIDVHDSGLGLSSSDIRQVMDGPAAGHGCANSYISGLVAARHLVEFLGGEILIKSARGFGSKVTMSLPAATRDVVDRTSVPEWDVTGKEKAVINGYPIVSTFVQNVSDMGIKVLVVDNDLQRIRKTEELLSESVLRRSDVQVTYCVDALEAIREIEETSYDLLLIDANMPGVDGYQLLKFIDENETACLDSLKVIFDCGKEAGINSVDQGRLDVYSFGGDLAADDVQNLMRRASLKAIS